MSAGSLKFATRSIHAGASPHAATGARVLPIFHTNGFVFDDLDHGSDIFALKRAGFSYSRGSNPNLAALEARIASLEGGTAAVACGSGQAALLTVILALCATGDEVVSGTALFGGSLTLLKRLDKRLTVAEQRELRAHLRECQECAALERKQRAQRAALKGLAGIPLPHGLASFAGGGSAIGGGIAVGSGLLAKVAAVVAATAVVGGVTGGTMNAVASDSPRPERDGQLALVPKAPLSPATHAIVAYATGKPSAQGPALGVAVAAGSRGAARDGVGRPVRGSRKIRDDSGGESFSNAPAAVAGETTRQQPAATASGSGGSAQRGPVKATLDGDPVAAANSVASTVERVTKKLPVQAPSVVGKVEVPKPEVPKPDVPTPELPKLPVEPPSLPEPPVPVPPPPLPGLGK